MVTDNVFSRVEFTRAAFVERSRRVSSSFSSGSCDIRRARIVWFGFCAAALALALSACSSAPKSLTFRDGNPSGLLVYKFDGYEPFIVKIDSTAGLSEGDQIRLGNGTTVYSNALDSRFGSITLPHGEYAIVLRAHPITLYQFELICYEQLAPVFRVQAGKVNVVEGFDDFVSRVSGRPRQPNLLAEAKAALSGFPNVIADVQLAEARGAVSFSKAESQGLIRPVCGSGSKVTAATIDGE